MTAIEGYCVYNEYNIKIALKCASLMPELKSDINILNKQEIANVITENDTFADCY